MNQCLFDPETEKRCFKCEKVKLRSEFYRHSATRDGLLGKCIECAKNDVTKNREEKADYYRSYDKSRATLSHRVAARKEYSKSAEGKKSHAKSLLKNRENFPEKYKARVKFRNAVRDGKVLKQPCSVCGELKAEGHHPDYSKPLEVIWLCNKHHRAEHRATSERFEFGESGAV